MGPSTGETTWQQLLLGGRQNHGKRRRGRSWLGAPQCPRIIEHKCHGQGKEIVGCRNVVSVLNNIVRVLSLFAKRHQACHECQKSSNQRKEHFEKITVFRKN